MVDTFSLKRAGDSTLAVEETFLLEMAGACGIKVFGSLNLILKCEMNFAFYIEIMNKIRLYRENHFYSYHGQFVEVNFYMGGDYCIL